jgi:hypothetical protein
MTNPAGHTGVILGVACLAERAAVDRAAENNPKIGMNLVGII